MPTIQHGEITFHYPVSPGRIIEYLDRPRVWIDARGKRAVVFYGARLMESGDLLVEDSLAVSLVEAPEVICFLDFYLINNARTGAIWVRMDAPGLPLPTGKGSKVPRALLRKLTPVELGSTGGQLVWAIAPWEPAPPGEEIQQAHQAAARRQSGGAQQPHRREAPGAAPVGLSAPVQAWYTADATLNSLLAPPRYRGGVPAILLAHPKDWSEQMVSDRTARVSVCLGGILGMPVTGVGAKDDFVRRYGQHPKLTMWDQWPRDVATSSKRGHLEYQMIVVPVSEEPAEWYTLGKGVGLLTRFALQAKLPVVAWSFYTGQVYLVLGVREDTKSFTSGWAINLAPLRV